MPTKVRDNSPERRRDEKKHSRPDKERSDKKERRHRSGTHRTSSTREKTSSRTSLSSTDSKRRSSLPNIEDDTEGLSKTESRSSLPYPTFSKAHSKEAIRSNPTVNVYTPPATDVDAEKERIAYVRTTNGPPSPPLTDRNAGRPRAASSRRTPVETILEEEKKVPEEGKKESKPDKITAVLRPKSSRSSNHLRSASDAGSDTSPTKSRNRTSTPLKQVETHGKGLQRSVSQPTRPISPTPSVETATELTIHRSSSNTTSAAADKTKIQKPIFKATPTAMVNAPIFDRPMSIPSGARQQTSFVAANNASTVHYPAPSLGGPPPPPPPPPPVMPLTTPKVDYLLQYGGLNQPVTKNLLYAGKPMAVQQAADNPGQQTVVVANLFEPYNSLLSDYERVIAKNGSLAVATGYRSVARRLLDRLGQVFARDISSEQCNCEMCSNTPQLEDPDGVSWGEILELVSGRRDLPSWPPFTFVTTSSGLGISVDMQTPMQKVDIDVPEEYREHYIRQSRKTKQSVDKWLSRQSDDQNGPPEDADDETLTFTILTHLPAEQRQDLKGLLGIIDRPLGPPRRAPSPDKGGPRPPPTPQPRARNQHIITAGQAIQRLYRLEAAPRDPETAFFLLKNRHMHDTLATLAAISDDEWDILISGRFDGFLRSGAEDFNESIVNGRYTPSRGPSRGPTPSYGVGIRYPMRQPTPAVVTPQSGAPIAFDEETEIATLAEMERDIYTGMEALEDAFEALHQRAEAVRRALRERSAGLVASSQRRRGANASQIDVRLGTPVNGLAERWESEEDDGMGDWDGVSDIAPDDSASNISSARKRRPKRRNERRTPAMIDEEDEDDYADESERSRSPRKR